MTLRKDIAAGLLAGGLSSVLLLGAFAFQYLGGLPPCEMCIWQRWPHGAAITLGIGGAGLALSGAVSAKTARPLAWLAVIALVVTGAIGIFHAGVEWKFWQGPSHCSGGLFVPGQDNFAPIQVVRCDEALWRFLGISLAGYNAIFSLAVAAISAAWLRREENPLRAATQS
jgi:disulfide bond formation protein DsbB